MNFVRMCSRLDPRCYKAFLSVVNEGSYSLAANKAAMTVSGISQHIANIEEVIGMPVFIRTSKGCKLTEQGDKFYQFIKNYNNLVTEFFEDINYKNECLHGLVRYAMPASCLLSPHFPMLLDRRLEYPNLELNVQLLPNEGIFDQIIDGSIDFGFVTERIKNPIIEYQSFCQEEYILVYSSKISPPDISENTFIKQHFIVYPGFNTYANKFIAHYFPNLDEVDYRSLYHISGRINSIDGAIKMVAGGLGISVFPRHCVEELINSKKLCIYTSHQKVPLLNDIYIAHHAEIVMPKRVTAVIQWFMDMMH